MFQFRPCRYIKKMHDQPCCPLCHKDLKRNEITDLTNELSDQIEMLPENITRSEQLLKDETIKLEKLLAMQSIVERVDNLKSIIMPKVKEDIKQLETNIVAEQEKMKNSQNTLEAPKNQKTIVESMIGDMSILDEAIRDIEQTQTDLAPMKQSLPASDHPADNNLESLQRKRKEITEKIKLLDREIERKEKRCQDEAKQLMQCQEREMELKQIELNLLGDVQKSDTLKAREKELTEQITQLKEKMETNDRSLIPIEAKINNSEEKRTRTRKIGAENYSSASKRFDALKMVFNSIERVSKELQRLASMNLEREIERYTAVLTQLKNDQKQQVRNCVEYIPFELCIIKYVEIFFTNFSLFFYPSQFQVNVIESIREKSKMLTTEIAEQKNTERDLNDNLELKKYEKKVIDKQKELETLRKHEQEVDFQQIIDKKMNLEYEMERITLDRTRIEGEMNNMKKSLEHFRTEINQPQYRDSIQNYKKASYENIVLNKTVEDLITYCEALEKALTKFHSDKMEKINRSIRDLWRSIYKGNDIDYIQINTEEVKGTRNRRSYT